MLKYMREHATSWIIKILLGAIVIVFVFWGVGSFSPPTGLKAAVVNGDLITVEEYQNAYNNLVEQYRQRFRGNFTDDMIKSFGLSKQVMDMLIEEKLLVQEAAKLNLKVTQEELVDTISKFEVFHQDGVFDQELYERVLIRNRLTPEKFEALQTNASLTAKMKSLVLDGVKVSDEEVKEWFDWNDTTVKIDYVVFEPSSYKDIEPQPEDVFAYYEAHKESYKTDPQVKVQFLHFKPETYEPAVQISDEELKDYYDIHADQFQNPRTVEARHILIKTEADMPQEEIDRKKEKASEIMKLAREGKNFEELAKQHSEDPGSKDNGGYLGAFKQEAMVKPFADAAFSMNPGDISDPVLTQFGWHIIKVEKINEESVTSFEEAAPKITKNITGDKARTLAYNDAENVYDSLQQSDDLSKAAADRKLDIQTTGLFTKTGPETGVMNRTRFASAAFALPVMGISEVQDFGDGYYILQTTEKVPEDIAPFEDVEATVRLDLIAEKQDEAAKKQAEEFLAALKAGEPMTEAVKKYNLTATSTEPFKRNDSIPIIGYEPDITKAVFELSEAKVFPETPVKGQKGYYVVAFAERKLPSEDDFEKQKDSVRQRLTQQKQFSVYDTWLTEVKTRSLIVIEDAYLN